MILEVCGLWFWHLYNCGWHVFPQIDTKMQTVLKLTSFDFVLSGQGNRKQNSDFRQMQILVSISRSSFLECLHAQLLPAFTTFLHVTWKSGPLDVYCSLNKPKFLSGLKYVQIPILAVLDSKVLVNRGRQIGLSLSQWIDSSAIEHNIAHYNAFCITNSMKKLWILSCLNRILLLQ